MHQPFSKAPADSTKDYKVQCGETTANVKQRAAFKSYKEFEGVAQDAHNSAQLNSNILCRTTVYAEQRQQRWDVVLTGTSQQCLCHKAASLAAQS